MASNVLQDFLNANTTQALSSLGATAPLSVNGAPVSATPTGLVASNTVNTSTQLQQALANLETAINSGNQKQYDLALGDLMGVFQGEPTLNAKKLGESAREFDLGLGKDIIGTAAGLNGPADYGDFMKYTGLGKTLLQQVQGGRAASSAPTQATEPMTIQTLMQKLGLAPGSSGTPAPTAAASVGQPRSTVMTVWGAYDPAAAEGSKTNNAALRRLVLNQYMGSGGPAGSGQTMLGERNTDAISDEEISKLVGDYMAGRGGGGTQVGGGGSSSDDMLSALKGAMPGTDFSGYDPTRLETAYNNYFNPTAAPSSGSSAMLKALQGAMPGTDFGSYGPDQLQQAYNDYFQGNGPVEQEQMKAPNVADNMDMLHQLGFDNPKGLQMLENPQGNVNPMFWDSLGPVGKQLFLAAASKVYGWDPTELQRQINATRPLGSPYAPDMVRTAYAPLAA